MTDDRKRPPSHWDDEKRALEHRRHNAPALGVPQVDAEDLTPPPQDLLDLCEDDAERSRFTERWYGTPAASTRHRARIELGSQVAGLTQRVATLERWKKWLIGALTTAVVGSGGAVITVAKGLYERGSFEGRLELRLDHAEAELERARDEIERLRYRRSYERSSSLRLPAFAPTKEEDTP